VICILHGYLLDGSGSNLWTQAIIRSLCRNGETVHLMCQEPHPEKFDYVAKAVRYDALGAPRVILEQGVPYAGRCVLHKPTLGPVLPVYVWDEYEEYDQVVPMVELDDATIEDYVRRNAQVLEHIITENGITVVHANHAVLMSVVARQVSARTGIPYAIMPHGSAIEYAVKRDPRFHRLAADAFEQASRIFVIGPEIRQRVLGVFADMPELESTLVDLNLGVDTSLFLPVERAQRPGNIRRLAAVLEGVERGKSPEQSRQMRDRLADHLECDALREAIASASNYTAKHLDLDCEAKLEQIDWRTDRVLLFVGRLIASKGIQAILAALPAILEREPRTRLVVVGHGPLREPLEAMLWALDTGSRTLYRNIVAWGRALERDGAPSPLAHVQAYLEQLEEHGELEQYLESARRHRLSERVVFTGYLTHRELRYLFPCCDVAIFPSIVAEAGPLVFLEAMASGVFPMGIYFAGMAASIDSVAGAVPDDVVSLMKLRAEPEHTVADIVEGAVGALALGGAHASALRQVAIDRYDWASVARRLKDTLEGAFTKPPRSRK
jgi:glycosyltransferase involved in cell wall biosynthesis